MPELEFFPQQTNDLLLVASRTIRAGETFEVSEEDAAELLANPEIRHPGGEPPRKKKSAEQEAKINQDSPVTPVVEQSKTQSPSSGTATNQPDRS